MQKLITSTQNPFPFFYRDFNSLQKSFTCYVNLKIPNLDFRIKYHNNNDEIPLLIDFSVNWLTYNTGNLTFTRKHIRSNLFTVTSTTNTPITLYLYINGKQDLFYTFEMGAVYSFKLIPSGYIRLTANTSFSVTQNLGFLAVDSLKTLEFSKDYSNILTLAPIDDKLDIKLDVTFTFPTSPIYFYLIDEYNKCLEVDEFNIVFKNV